MDKWLLQKNIWNEYAYDRFIQSIKDADIPFEEVEVIPFIEDFVNDINFIPKHVFGSGRFVNICRMKGYPTFNSFNPIEKFYPLNYWINGDGKNMTWGKFKNRFVVKSPVFVKPYTEKFFTGLVISDTLDKEKVQLATSFIDNADDELIRVSPCKNILQEVRFYVVYGRIVSGSIYKNKGIGEHLNVDINHGSWAACQNILSECGGIDDAFVMDMGLVDSAWKIVELNNVNSSSLYAIDTDAVVNAFKYM